MQNVLWGLVYNVDEFPGAIQVDDLAVEAGDTYADGVFYHGGDPVRTRTEIWAELWEALNILLGGELA